MPELLYGYDKEVAAWVAAQIGMFDYDPCRAIGIVDGNRIIGGAIYNNMHNDANGNPLLIEISFATIDKKWASRHIISGLLGYPFIQLKLKRVQSTVAKRNKRVRLFLERLGFKLEGVGRQAWPHGGDACMYSMLRDECRWITTEKPIGKISTLSASRSGSRSNV